MKIGQALAVLQGVDKAYGQQRVLDGLDLSVHAGELLALLGPNGAGKSTAVAMMLGLDTPDAGRVVLCGQAPGELAARRGAGVMLQEAELPASLRAGELIELTGAYYPSPLSVVEAAQRAGIEDLIARPYGKLSGGQKRRVQFAMAIVGRPCVLFLDEPTTGLDVEARSAIWQAVRQLVAEGCGVLLTTHYLEEAEALADRVVMLAQGQIVAEGSVETMRAFGGGRRLRCRTAIAVSELALWPGVRAASSDGDAVTLEVDDAESLLRRLLDADPTLSDLEVTRAGLAEAFLELTRRSLQ